MVIQRVEGSIQTRTSGVELCRVLAMLMIVAGHFIGQSGIASIHGDSMWLRLCGCGARWAVNVFLVIGCWFMVDYRFRVERIARLYLTVLFYAVPLTILGLVLGNPTTKDVLRGFVPFCGRPLWFFSAYISLALVAPWLKSAFKQEFGTTVFQCLFDRRMELASHYLLDSQLPIAEVGFLLGYDYQSHFCTAFRRKYGISPSEYREQKGDATLKK